LYISPQHLLIDEGKNIGQGKTDAMKNTDKTAKLARLSLVEGKEPAAAETVEGYRSSLEHLTDELERLELRLRLQLVLEDKAFPGNGLPALPFLERHLPTFPEAEAEVSPEMDAGYFSRELARVTRRITQKVEASLQLGIKLPLPRLSQQLKLKPLEEDILIACLAPELDRRFEVMYAYLQDDLTSRSPTVDMLLRLFTSTEEERAAARLVFDQASPLMRYLMDTTGEWKDSRVPLLAKPLKLENWTVNHLLGFQMLDERLLEVAELCFPHLEPQSAAASVPSGTAEDIVGFVRYYSAKETSPHHLFYCCGPDGAEAVNAIKAACLSLERPLLMVDTDSLPLPDGDYSQMLRLLGRHALLDDAALCFVGFDSLTTEGEGERSRRRIKSLLEMLCSCAPLAFIVGESSWSQQLPNREMNFIQIEFTLPGEQHRLTMWEQYSRDYTLLPQIDLTAFTDKFRFTPGQIRAALRNGENLAVWKGDGSAESPDRSPAPIGEKELYESCYLQSGRSLQALATKVKPFYSWDMLVLPLDQTEQLREICRQMKHRALVYGRWGFDKRLSLGKGMNVMFAGPPGVGKTMAAEVIAGELSLELYKIDVSQIVSKYIGETEKNLSRIFKEAETSNAILFFDEADALFGKRSEVKDAHDRYANVETSYLLQKMEEYTGIVILATNLSQNLDEAFLRRLHARVEFPFPEKPQREAIWRGMFPKDAPLDTNLDFAFMADKLNLAGGSIKNIALNAAFFAAHEGSPIGMRHIMLAAKREYIKQGKTFLKTDYDPYDKLMEV
jgi:hypothetical protein